MRQLAGGVLLAVGLLLLAFYLAPWRGAVPPEGLPPELEGEPDLYMENAVISQFQDDGTLQYRLTAQQVRAFDAHRHAELINPNLSLHSPAAPPWQVSARRGTLHGWRDGAAALDSLQCSEPPMPKRQPVRHEAGANCLPAAHDAVLMLSGDVVLSQNDPELGFARMRTAELRVRPGPRYAETERDVMIETEAGRTVAQGLKADLQRRILNLQADADGPVHTIVLPERIGQ